MEHIAIDIEQGACDKLRAHLSHELAHAYAANISRKAQKLASHQLLEARCRDDEVVATVVDKGVHHRVRMIFPLFDDDGYSYTQCSCLERVAHLDEQRCPHMWMTQTHILAKLTADIKRQEAAQAPLAKRFAEVCDAALADATGSNADQRRQNLAWLLRPDLQFELRLIEGTPSPSNQTGLGRGRKVSPGDFLSKPDLWRHSKDQLAAARLLCRGDGASAEPNIALTAHLLGDLMHHPQLFMSDDGRPLTIKQASLAIGVETNSQGLALRAFLQDEPLANGVLLADGGCCVLHGASATLLFSPAAQGLHDLLAFILAHWQRVIPSRHKAWVFKSLSRVQHMLPLVHAGEGESAASRIQAANDQLYLRLTPIQPHGASLEFLQKPLLGGDYIQPGGGAATLWDFSNTEEPCRVERNLVEETEFANDLAAHLKLASMAMQQERYAWHFAHDEDVLAVLEQLDRHPHRRKLIVVWPKNAERSFEVVEVNPDTPDEPVTATIKRHNDWFELQGVYKINGQEVSLADLIAAVEAQRPYVKLPHGQWLRISSAFRKRLTELCGFVDQRPSHNPYNASNEQGGSQSLPLALSPASLPLLEAWQQTDALQLSEPAAEWQAEQERFRQAQQSRVEVPATLHATLRSYQKQGFEWLYRLATWQRGAILADDMGLGKTVQTIALLLAKAAAGPALIIAPTSVVANWESELARFAPALRCYSLHNLRSSTASLPGSAGDVVIASYGLMQRQVEALAAVPWAILVLDEAQMIKNATTKTARHLHSIPRGWTLALSGTPIENHLGELWSLFHAVQPSLLGSWESFREQYARPIEQSTQSPAKKKLQARIAPFILRRSKQEFLSELPEKTEIIHSLPLGVAERELYDKLRLEAVAAITQLEAAAKEAAADDDSGVSTPAGPGKPSMQVLAYLTRLRQLCCHPRLVEGDWSGESAKQKHFLSICHELQLNGHRALVFSQFASFLKILRDSLQATGVPLLYLDGATPLKERRELVTRFQAGEAQFFLISLKAGGTGLNLTAADYVIHMDPWWNPAVEAQASDRAHRMGQKKPVTIYRFITHQSVEEKILALHAHKQHLAADLLGSNKTPVKLSYDVIKSLITEA